MLKFHHIGIACKEIDKTKQWVEQTHNIVHEKGPVFDSLQNATLYIMCSRDGLMFELISGGQVDNIIKKNITLYHLCYTVSQIDEAIEWLIDKGAVVFSPPQEAILFNNKKVAFLYTPLGVIELLEE